MQTQDSLDRLATACENLLYIVITLAVLLGLFMIGFVFMKVYGNHRDIGEDPSKTNMGPTTNGK